MSLLWILLPLLTGSIALFAWEYLQWRRSRITDRPLPPPYRNTRFTILESDGTTQNVVSTEDSISFGFTSKSDVSLPKRRYHDPSRPRGFTCRFRNDALTITTKKPLLINGVDHTKRELIPGDRIFLDDLRIVFNGIEIIRPEPPAQPEPKFAVYALPVVALSVASILFHAPIVLGPDTEVEVAVTSTTEPETEHGSVSTIYRRSGSGNLSEGRIRRESIEPGEPPFPFSRGATIISGRTPEAPRVSLVERSSAAVTQTETNAESDPDELQRETAAVADSKEAPGSVFGSGKTIAVLSAKIEEGTDRSYRNALDVPTPRSVDAEAEREDTSEDDRVFLLSAAGSASIKPGTLSKLDEKHTPRISILDTTDDGDARQAEAPGTIISANVSAQPTNLVSKKPRTELIEEYAKSYGSDGIAFTTPGNLPPGPRIDIRIAVSAEEESIKKDDETIEDDRTETLDPQSPWEISNTGIEQARFSRGKTHEPRTVSDPSLPSAGTAYQRASTATLAKGGIGRLDASSRIESVVATGEEIATPDSVESNVYSQAGIAGIADGSIESFDRFTIAMENYRSFQKQKEMRELSAKSTLYDFAGEATLVAGLIVPLRIGSSLSKPSDEEDSRQSAAISGDDENLSVVVGSEAESDDSAGAADTSDAVKTAVTETEPRDIPDHELAVATTETGEEDPSGIKNGKYVAVRPASEFRIKPLAVFGPDNSIDFFDADILFIHAHPDDEAIDFGGLMAKAARADMRIATVIFTDGESGLDIYPERFVDDTYPPYDLKDEALSKVRINELEHSLSVLGSDHYVRLGLKNNPYTGIDDVLELPEVFRRWGGKEKLKKKLKEIIIGYNPDFIISPDGPGEALEHFEHEAVGELVSEVVTELVDEAEAEFLRGHLASVDPRFLDEYPDAIRINVNNVDPETGLTYRQIQVEALKQHITQRDAAVIEVDRRQDKQFEYYQVEYLRERISLEDILP